MTAVYLSVENATRELDAKLLVALDLVRRGATVIVGQQWLLNENLPHMPPGVVLFKGLNRVQIANMANARQAGHIVAANDEEAMGVGDAAFMLRDVSRDLPAVCDLLLCQGPTQRDWLADVMPADRLTVTGNPRTDLLRPELRAVHQPEIDRIRAEYGRFVLLNTNCGGINSAWGDAQQYCAVLVNIGWLDPTKPEDIKLFQDHMRHDAWNLNALQGFISALDWPVDGVGLVVRPHPSERLEPWQAFCADRQGVRIAQEGTAVPWVLASEILVHTGCTTGVEAAIAGHPTVCIAAPTGFAMHYLANRVNHLDLNGGGAAWTARDCIWRGTRPALFTGRGTLEPYFAALDGPFAYQRVAEAIMAIAPRSAEPWAPGPGFRPSVRRPDYIRRKMDVTLEQFVERVGLLDTVAGARQPIATAQIGESMFVMRPAQ